MKRRALAGCCGAIVAGALLLVGASWAQDTASTQPASVHDDAYWKALEERLGAEAYPVRAAATNELDKIPWREEAKLRQLMGQTSDEQVKASLEARIEGITEELATNPPGISVDLHQSQLSEVVRALKAATGVSMSTWPNQSDRAPTFTLTMKDQPFWEVFAALSRQHSLMVQRNNQLQIVQSDPGMQKLVPATAGFWVFPGPITRSRRVDLQAEPGKQVGAESLMIEYRLAMDPRVKIVGQIPPELTDVRDDAGNELLVGPGLRGRRGRNFMVMWDQGLPVLQAASSLKIVDHMGKRIASAKGEAKFQVQISEDVVNVDKPEEKLKQDLAVGSGTVTIEKFEAKDRQIAFSIQSKTPVQQGMMGRMGRISGPLPIQMQVLGKGDEPIWESRLYGGTGGSISVGDNPGPYRLRFSAVTRTKEIEVEFEMKDLPIP